jgi:TonB family protein
MRSCILLSLAILSATLHAQTIRGALVAAVPGMPFTGQETIVWTHQVSDKTITSRLVGTIARDGKGRVYREIHRFNVDPVDPRTTLLRTTVIDPIAGVTTDCDLSTDICRITARSTLVGMSLKTVREDLGSKVIDGLTATGTRNTTQPPVSNFPNGAQTPSTNEAGPSTFEAWYSDDLKANLSELRKNPRGEVQDIHLTITSRTEPDPKIFTVPTGFTVQDDSAIRRIGGDVSAPVLIYNVNPAFSEEARAAKKGGNVLINLVVDQNGNPTHVRVIRGIGYGLDEKAIEAVKQYRFKPAMQEGKPVPVELNLEINFKIF